MNNVKTSNLGNLKSVFSTPDLNKHYYKIIARNIEGNAALEFCKPVFNNRTGVIDWYSTQQGNYTNYDSLAASEKQKVDLAIQKELNSLAKQLGGQAGSDDSFENFFEIPSTESILVADNGKILLTEWGFISDGQIKGYSVLKKIVDNTKRSLILHFKDEYEEDVTGLECDAVINGSLSSQVTDEKGFIKLNNLEHSTTVQIKSPSNRFVDHTINVDETGYKLIYINENTRLSFTFIDSDGDVLPEMIFQFICNGNMQRLMTDMDGSYELKIPPQTGSFQIATKHSENLLNEPIPIVDRHYSIVIGDEKRTAPSDSDFLEEESLEETIVVLEFLNWRKKAIKNQKLELFNYPNIKDFTTNENGQVHLKHLTKDKEYSIFMRYKGTDWRRDFVHKIEERHTFVVKQKRFLLIWLPLLLALLGLATLIPTSVDHDYYVFDKNTLQPLAGALLESSASGKTITIASVVDGTDSTGHVYKFYSEASIYDQIFNKQITPIAVTLQGYESIESTIPQGFFDTDTSNIYLSKLRMQPPKSLPRVTCNNAGDADDAGANVVQEFNLGQNSGDFVFQYYTGNMIPDIINIYDTTQENIFISAPIWSFNDITPYTQEVTLYFTNQIITVEVIGGNNKESLWAFEVSCPQNSN